MTDLAFQIRGSGHPVILLHGFPFHQEMWSTFAEKLAQNFQVLTPDLPGFGKSYALESPFSLDDVGTAVVAWVKAREIKNPVLIGHSLGGYVALAAVRNNPTLFAGLVLFHSTAYPDTEEKKQNRNKVLEFIEKNGVDAFTSNFIAPLFADPNHKAIPIVKKIATQASAEAVKGYTQAMRDREDRTGLLRTFAAPILFLGGEKDGGISVESLRKQATLSTHCEVQILENVAHMGMFENEKKCLEILQSFIVKKIVTM